MKKSAKFRYTELMKGEVEETHAKNSRKTNNMFRFLEIFSGGEV